MSRTAAKESAENGVRASRARIAVTIPCYNEEITIRDVIEQFRAQLPQADIYVFDNNSTDRTIEHAREAGAIVYEERRQGKGFVVQSMFRRIDADVYVMVDGDGTYPAAEVHRLIAPVLRDEADMVVGSRLHAESQSEFKQMNRWYNRIVISVLNSVFRVRLTDMLSGYRAFNKRFVKRLPLFGGGFEIETELTIKAFKRGYRIAEVPINLVNRPAGSHSKIHVVRDSFIILNTILVLFRDYKPLTFFGSIGLLLIFAGLIPGVVLFVEFLQSGSLARLPLAVLGVSLLLCGLLSITAGLILHSIARRAQEFDYQLQVLFDELGRARPAEEHARLTRGQGQP